MKYHGIHLSYLQRQVLAHWGSDCGAWKWRALEALEAKGLVRYFHNDRLVGLTERGVEIAKQIRKDLQLTGSTEKPLIPC